MKKFLLVTLLSSCASLSFAAKNTVDMTNLKCGNLQVYNTTTLQDIKDSCKLKKANLITHGDNLNIPESYFAGQKTLYEVQFYSTSQKGLIKCDFINGNPDSKVLGCRNNR